MERAGCRCVISECLSEKVNLFCCPGYRTLVPSCAGDRACQTCHHWPEQELRDRVEQIQTRFYDTRQIAMDALMDLIHDIKTAKDAGATDAELQNAWQAQREGGFSIDFLVSENSMGFHADQYSATAFAEAINTCRQGQLALRRDVKSVGVQFPSIPNTQLGQRTQDGK